jgi:ParB family chromosome partitioning protein
MGKSSKNANRARGSTNLLMYLPEDLTLVTDETHPLYDPRVHLPVSEAMVRNIIEMGVIEPVIVSKNPETGDIEVVDGRQRVKNTAEANIRLNAKGCDPILIPAVVRPVKRTQDNAGAMVSANEIRTPDSPLGRAGKMASLVTYGKTSEDLAVIFGCTAQTVTSTLALLECCSAVKNAVEAGKIGVGHARALSKLSPADQRSKVKELEAAGESLKGHAKARQQRAIVGGSGAPRMRTRAQIVAERDLSTGVARAVLQWVLGEAGGTLLEALALGEVAEALKGSPTAVVCGGKLPF